MLDFDIIVAVDSRFGIGKEGKLPWHLPLDLKHFRELTISLTPGKMNAVIMGRKTWDTIPQRFRPLPQRLNIVLTRNRNLAFDKSVVICAGLDQAFQSLETDWRDVVEKVFVIGGAQVYKDTVQSAHCKNIFLTQVMHDFNCDAFFPQDLSKFKKVHMAPVQNDQNISFRFTHWTRIGH